jgi:hypothetical protein
LRLLKVGVHRVSGLPDDAPASAQRQPTGTAPVVLVPLGASIAVVQAGCTKAHRTTVSLPATVTVEASQYGR